MQLWHLTPDTPRTPPYPNVGEQVTVRSGTYPIEDEQTVWVGVCSASRRSIRQSFWQTQARIWPCAKIRSSTRSAG